VRQRRLGEGRRDVGRVVEESLEQLQAIGDLVLNNVALQVVDRKIVRGADGVIGADVFREFLVTLDGKSRTLELTPLQGVMETEAASIQMPAYSISHLLLVRATLDGVREGYYLLDTGSANSVISKNVEVSVSGSVPLWGAQGEVAGAHRIQPVNLKLGPPRSGDRRHHRLLAPRAVRPDHQLSRRLGADQRITI